MGRRKSSSQNSLWSLASELATDLAMGFGYGLYKAFREGKAESTAARARLPRKPKKKAKAKAKTTTSSAAPTTPRRKRSPAKWWKVLGIPETATPQEIKTAYRARMHESHPDKVAHLSPTLRKAAEREAKRINDAYERSQQKTTRPSTKKRP